VTTMEEKTNLQKSLQYGAGRGPVATFNKIANSPETIKLLYTALQQGKLLNTIKEVDASLSDSEAEKVANRVLDEIFSNATPRVGDAYGSWKSEEEQNEEAAKALRSVVFGLAEKHLASSNPAGFIEFQKEFDDVLNQVSQPKGGTENMTNVASPGQAPGKISAVPGKSGSNTTGSYRTRDDPVNNFNPGSLSELTYTRPGLQGTETPPATTNPNASRTNVKPPHLSHGPVGTAGDTDHIPSTSRQRPGEVGTVDVSQYKGANPRDMTYKAVRPQLGFSPKTTEVQPLNKERAGRIAKSLGLHLLKSERDRLVHRRTEEDFAYGQGDTPGVAVPGTEGDPVGWSGQGSDASNVWDNSLDSPNRTISTDDPFGEEETEEARQKREANKLLETRADEMEEYARVADRQAEEAYMEGNYEARDEMRQKAISLREGASELRKKMLKPTLTK
jgi:hypothetical protein